MEGCGQQLSTTALESGGGGSHDIKIAPSQKVVPLVQIIAPPPPETKTPTPTEVIALLIMNFVRSARASLPIAIVLCIQNQQTTPPQRIYMYILPILGYGFIPRLQCALGKTACMGVYTPCDMVQFKAGS